MHRAERCDDALINSYTHDGSHSAYTVMATVTNYGQPSVRLRVTDWPAFTVVVPVAVALSAATFSS
ncbi:hypothetical protein Ari01nite_79840 [Paractinoplanes rishiriensis]|uniref:Uncharacterized protein n=1 Tax=Paractinoplanes rishiriensis TaxID=1050105 RepID=A0A919K8A7_9ACTN|nr:hypothetical protein Ari01nite_79840 [Actinoplanes rishiriensis]